MPDIRASQHEPIGMDGVGRVGDEHGVTWAGRGQGQMGEALLGADGDDGLGVGVQLNVEPPVIPVAYRLAQADDALGHRITMRRAFLRDLDQFVDDMLGRRPIRIAHAEVDDIDSRRPLLSLEFVDDIENIRRQPFDALEFFHPGYCY